jgi:hypothetical protein
MRPLLPPASALKCALAGIGLALAALAAVEPLDLGRMAGLARHRLAGEIIARQGFLGHHPELGQVPMTRLTVAGRELVTGKKTTLRVAYLGGTVDGVSVRCSTQPPDRETAPGNRVLLFAAPEEVYGCTMLVAQQGGLFRLQRGEAGEVVVGRGPGTAVPRNILLADLEADLARADSGERRGR